MGGAVVPPLRCRPLGHGPCCEQKALVFATVIESCTPSAMQGNHVVCGNCSGLRVSLHVWSFAKA